MDWKGILLNNKTLKIGGAILVTVGAMYLGIAPEKGAELVVMALGAAGLMTLKAGDRRVEKDVAQLSETFSDLLGLVEEERKDE